MKIKSFLSFLILILASCAPSQETINSLVSGTLTAIPSSTSYPTYPALPTSTTFPTYTPYPTQTNYPTYTPLPTIVLIVTPTESPMPIFTPTFTPIPTNTPDPLYAEKKPGFYLAGIDIGAGIWRSQGNSEYCYWSITTNTGNIIKNHFGMAGGTMYISSTAYQVEMDPECGKWVYLGE